MEAVYVEWVDSNSMPGWQAEEHVEEFAKRKDALVCRSVGFLLHDKSDRIVISSSLNYSNYASDPMAIPRDAILKIETIKELSWN